MPQFDKAHRRIAGPIVREVNIIWCDIIVIQEIFINYYKTSGLTVVSNRISFMDRQFVDMVQLGLTYLEFIEFLNRILSILIT